MTNQEIFDKVARHLTTQGRAAISPKDGKCLYRAPEGLSCAVGCLIPDDLYSPKMERKEIRGLMKARFVGIEEIRDFLGLTDPRRRRLLIRLQFVHDINLARGYPIIEPLRRTAADFRLDASVLGEAVP